MDTYEEILNNNYMVVNVEHIINCTLRRADLSLEEFKLTNGAVFSRGAGLQFTLRAQVRIRGVFLLMNH